MDRLPGQVPGLAYELGPSVFGRKYDALGLDKIKKLHDHLDTLVVKVERELAQNPKPVDRLANPQL